MSRPIQQGIRERLRSAIRRHFELELEELSVEIPPRTALGDLAFPIAFDLAKRLKAKTGEKQNPRRIAEQLASELSDLKGVDRVETAGAGYINVFLNRAAYLLNALGQPAAIEPTIGGKVIVEHTSVNPNKAAHVGHLRNAVLGDTIARLLRASGESVEVQNYIDNTGVQVADVVVGFKYLERKDIDQVKALASIEPPPARLAHGDEQKKQDQVSEKSTRFDYYCWDLYARVGAFYEEDPARLELRSRTLHEIEAGEGEAHEMADYVSTRILNCHIDTMLRLGIKYDLFPRESEVLHLHIWERAFDLLRERHAVELESAGRLAGCWVMRGDGQAGSEPGEESEHEADKVIVRSNGTVTYTGKDIAFHLWKLGRLGIDFYYKQFRVYPDGHTAWITASDRNENDLSHPRFGDGTAYFNVIDIGQSYPQHYVKLGVTAVASDSRVERSAHLAYEKVVLSAATAEQLGQRLSEEDRHRGVVSMSGRKGLGVKVDDLIDTLEANAFAEVAARHADLDRADQEAAARSIAVGALRYFLLKYTRTSIITFDFKEALSFEGETGPYIQYSVVRANSIFRKLDEAQTAAGPSIEQAPPERIRELLRGDEGDELWGLFYLASRLGDTIRSAVGSLEPAIVAKWAFHVAQNFNLFYHKYHILSEPDPTRRALLVAITRLVRLKLVEALSLLGIEAPERM